MAHILVTALADFRARKLLSQADLAGQVGVSRSTIVRLEAGEGRSSVFLAVIARLGVTITGLPAGIGLGQRLKLARLRRKWTQAELAARIGASRATIVSFERTGQIRLELFLALADLLAPDAKLREERSHFGKGATDAWDTSPEFLELVHSIIPEFDLDPCSSSTSCVRSKAAFFEHDDGLVQKWRGDYVWLNPPYGDIATWVKKAVASIVAGTVRTVVALLPVRSNVRYWHHEVLGLADTFFIRGRLSFGRSKIAAPFASALVVWGGTPELIQRFKTVLTARHVPPEWKTCAAPEGD